jgi:N4-gp56 family major capsid protein
MNGVAEVPHALNAFYNRSMLERARPLIVHDMFAQIRDIPTNGTNVIKFRRYGVLAVNTTALTEGVTPAGKTLATTDISTTVRQYGDFIMLTDWLQITTPDPILTETSELLGDQAGQSLDVIIRDVIVAGTTVQYANGVANRGLVTSTDKIDTAEIKLAVRTLKRNNAKRLTSMVDPDNAYNTTAVDAAYVSIVHSDTTFDLQSEAAFVPVEKYANKAKLMPGEVGKLGEVRFIETTQAKKFVGEGNGGIDVYATLVLGMNAYGVSRISGNAMKNIIKTLGSAGTEDPLDQRSTSGWKASLGVTRLNESWMLRIEHAVSA